MPAKPQERIKCFSKLNKNSDRSTKLRNFVYMPSHSSYKKIYKCTEANSMTELGQQLALGENRLKILPVVFQDSTKNHCPVFSTVLTSGENQTVTSLVFFYMIPPKAERTGFWSSRNPVARVFSFEAENAKALLYNLEDGPTPKPVPPPSGENDPMVPLRIMRYERYWGGYSNFCSFMDEFSGCGPGPSVCQLRQ